MGGVDVRKPTKVVLGGCTILALRVGELEAQVADDLGEARATDDQREKRHWLQKWNADKRSLAQARKQLERCLAGNKKPPKTYVRREIWSLESANPFDPITLAYANAVRVMQSRPPNDPTSWSYQAAMHGTLAPVPSGAPWNACQHGGWFFLPWHRMYLYYFERIVRKAVLDAGGPIDFALPYWNYDRPTPGNTIPVAFRTSTLPDGTGNPLYLGPPLRRASYMNGWGLPQTATSPANALAETDFSSPNATSSFGGGAVGPGHSLGAVGSLEITPHGNIHVEIGGPGQPCSQGLMSFFECAALDPIFWLHHANIDRLWNVWRTLAGRTNPSDSGWLNQRFEFRDENGAAVSLSGADVLDTATQLDYIYDDQLRIIPAIPRPFELTWKRPGPPPELAAATEKPIVLTGSPVTAELHVPTGLRRALAAAVPDRRQLYLNIDDIEADANPGVNYEVYIETPGGGLHVGNISLFGIEELKRANEPHRTAPGFRHSFNITRAVHELADKGEWTPDSVRVRLEPMRGVPPPDAPRQAVEERISHPPVRIGSVSLFLG
jgi:Common central domain of tyrosinase/Polyphenol oxidase middle domain